MAGSEGMAQGMDYGSGVVGCAHVPMKDVATSASSASALSAEVAALFAAVAAAATSPPIADAGFAASGFGQPASARASVSRSGRTG